ncbi:MAG: glycosyltransferase [Candidatus Thorarchaeota archaeon]|jgi:glycosyltransferase involved in cell wall biosynthesis
MEKEATIIIPFLNEGNEPILTIESIYETASPDLFDIIVIDDCSNKRTENLDRFEDVSYVRNKTRMGVGACRDLGVSMAKTPVVFIFDAHMRFKEDNWCESLISAVKREPTTCFCTSCVGLSTKKLNATVENAKLGTYYGATIRLFEHAGNCRNKPENYRNIIEPKWLEQKSIPSKTKEFEIPCILGANYAFSTEWYMKIRGYEGLMMWGTSGPFISLKSWLAGGKCKIIPNIGIGHIFRDKAPYRTHSFYLLYNKMFIAKTILPEPLSTDLISFLGHNKDVALAKKVIETNDEVIRRYREYFGSIFRESVFDVFGRFGIDFAWPETVTRDSGP